MASNPVDSSAVWLFAFCGNNVGNPLVCHHAALPIPLIAEKTSGVNNPHSISPNPLFIFSPFFFFVLPIAGS